MSEYTKYIMVILIALLCIFPASADVVTHVWNTSLANKPWSSDMTYDGSYMIVGMGNGSILYYSADGALMWSNKSSTQNITKVVVNPTGNYYLAMDQNRTMYGRTTDGHVLYVANVSGYANEYMVDCGLSYDGQYWGFATTHNITVRNYTNGTIFNQTNTTTFVGISLDPDKSYVIGTTSGSILQKYIFNPTTYSNWYQGYTGRVKQSVTYSASADNGYNFTGVWSMNAVNLTIYNTSGSSSGSTIYLGSGVTLNNWYDLRFIDFSDNSTVIQHYRFSTDTNHVNVELFFPTFTKGQTKTYWIYYGNTSATDTSSNTGEKRYPQQTNYTPPSDKPFNWNAEYNGNWSKSFSSVTKDQTAHMLLPNANWSVRGSYSISAFVNGTDWNATYGYVGVQSIPLPTSGYSYNKSLISISYNASWAGNHTISAPIYCAFKITGKSLIYNVPFTGMSTFIGLSNGTYSSASSLQSIFGIGDRLYLNVTGVEALGDDPPPDHFGSCSLSVDNITFINELPPEPPSVSTPTVLEIQGIYLQATTTVTGTPYKVDLAPYAGSWMSIATDTRNVMQQISSTGFGTAYTYTQTGTPLSLSSGVNTNYIIETRSVNTYILSYGGVLEGTFTSGNNMISNGTDIAKYTGTWAISASGDNNIYLFGKSNSSDWYYAWSTPATSPTFVSMSDDGSNFAYGIAAGNIYYYETSETIPVAHDTYVQLCTYKNGNIPYPWINFTLREGTPTGAPYMFSYNSTTDSSGCAIIGAAATYFYEVVAYDSDGVTDIGSMTFQANDIVRTYYLYVWSPPIYTGEGTYVNAYWDNTSDVIVNDYTNGQGVEADVNVIIRSASTGLIVDEHYESATTGFEYNYTVTNTSDSYSIVIEEVVQGHTYEHVYVVSKPNRYYTDIASLLPTELIIGIFGMLILVLAGLFSPKFAGIGCVVITLTMGAMTLFNIIAFPPYVIALCALITGWTLYAGRDE